MHLCCAERANVTSHLKLGLYLYWGTIASMPIMTNVTLPQTTPKKLWHNTTSSSARQKGGEYLRCLLGPDREVLSARGQLVKALGGVDLAQNALREEGSLATLVTQEDDVQSLHQLLSLSN